MADEDEAQQIAAHAKELALQAAFAIKQRGRPPTVTLAFIQGLAHHLGVSTNTVRAALLPNAKPRNSTPANLLFDDIGLPIDDDFRAAMDVMRANIKSARSHISRAMRFLEAIGRGTSAVHDGQALETVTARLKEASKAAMSMMPHSVCPACKLVEHLRPSCPACHGLGYMNRADLEGCPPELLDRENRKVLIMDGPPPGRIVDYPGNEPCK